MNIAYTIASLAASTQAAFLFPQLDKKRYNAIMSAIGFSPPYTIAPPDNSVYAGDPLTQYLPKVLFQHRHSYVFKVDWDGRIYLECSDAQCGRVMSVEEIIRICNNATSQGNNS